MSSARHGTARHDTDAAWHGTARHGHGTARHGTARHGTARHATPRHGMARPWHGTAMARHGTARPMARHSALARMLAWVYLSRSHDLHIHLGKLSYFNTPHHQTNTQIFKKSGGIAAQGLWKWWACSPGSVEMVGLQPGVLGFTYFALFT